MKHIFILVSIALLFSCSPGSHELKVNNKYAITLPEAMKPVADLNEAASLQRADETRELYVVVIDESKEEMKKHDLDYDLDLYFRNIFSRNVIESLSDASISEPEKVAKDNASEMIVDVTGKADTTAVYYKAAIVETPSSFYQVLVWTTGSKREKLQEEMSGIVRSFREL